MHLIFLKPTLQSWKGPRAPDCNMPKAKNIHIVQCNALVSVFDLDHGRPHSAMKEYWVYLDWSYSHLTLAHRIIGKVNGKNDIGSLLRRKTGYKSWKGSI